MLATLVYKFFLKECLPGQYALGTLYTLYGVGVLKLAPGTRTAAQLSSALLRLIHNASFDRDAGSTSPTSRAERDWRAGTNARSGQYGNHRWQELVAVVCRPTITL